MSRWRCEPRGCEAAIILAGRQSALTAHPMLLASEHTGEFVEALIYLAAGPNGVREGNALDRSLGQADQHARRSVSQRVHRFRSQPRAEQAIIDRGRTTALDMAEHDQSCLIDICVPMANLLVERRGEERREGAVKSEARNRLRPKRTEGFATLRRERNDRARLSCRGICALSTNVGRIDGMEG
jgi:hypothetical protein